MALDKKLAADLSPSAVKKSVLAAVSQKPLTVYPAAAALLGSAYLLTFGGSLVAAAAVGAGVAVTSVNWLWEYFGRGGKHANEFVKRYREELELRRQEALKHLMQELENIGDTQGMKQVQLFREKYRNFVNILDRKLEPEELTYNRYLTIAEQVFLAGLDNLENAAVATRSVSAIDVDHIQREAERLQGKEDRSSSTKLTELKTRLNLRDKQLQRASDLLLLNEQALTQLDHVTTKLASISTKQGRAQVDLEDAMADLQHLIVNADSYSNVKN
jgi:hypothetical protein